MVQRSKRSMSPEKAREMKAIVLEFHWKVRMWAAEIPIGNPVYIGLDSLNYTLDLTNRLLNAEADGRQFERRYGEGGIE